MRINADMKGRALRVDVDDKLSYVIILGFLHGAPRASGAISWRHSNLARRSTDWNAGLARDLQDQTFAREFLLAAMEEGVPIQAALAKVVRATGVKEFAAKVRMASPNVLRAIDRRYNPTQRTLNRLLRPFKLRLGLAPIEAPKRRQAA